MTDVREERAPRMQTRHSLDRPIDRRMRGVRLIPQRIQKQHIQVLQQTDRFLRDLAVIGEIGGRTEAEAVDGLPAVQYRHRYELYAEQVEWAVDHLFFDLRNVGLLLHA